MTKLLWSPQSLRDLQSIRDYVATDSPRYAALVVERIVQGVERLAAFPDSGRVVHTVGTDECGVDGGASLSLGSDGPRGASG